MTMDLNATAQLILEEAKRRAVPATVEPHAPGDAREADPDSVSLTIPIADRPTHRLNVLQRGDTIEVAYHDGLPPGPAEAQFILERGQEPAVVRHAFDFVEAILQWRVRAVREPLPWWVRLVRRDCDSLLRFVK
jgi:hypothetical protein